MTQHNFRRLWLKNPLFLDTETTGIGSRAEVIQLAIVAADGTVLMDELIRPFGRMDARAQAIHGISLKQLRDKPTIDQLAGAITAHLAGRTVIAYNADFDTRLLRQSFWLAGVEWRRLFQQVTFVDLMMPYARFWGGRNGRWQKLADACQQQSIRLTNAHSALADAQATRLLLMRLAGVTEKANAK
jgi:DNA polymerase-3 subunit epsilon